MDILSSDSMSVIKPIFDIGYYHGNYKMFNKWLYDKYILDPNICSYCDIVYTIHFFLSLGGHHYL